METFPDKPLASEHAPAAPLNPDNREDRIRAHETWVMLWQDQYGRRITDLVHACHRGISTYPSRTPEKEEQDRNVLCISLIRELLSVQSNWHPELALAYEGLPEDVQKQVSAEAEKVTREILDQRLEEIAGKADTVHELHLRLPEEMEERRKAVSPLQTMKLQHSRPTLDELGWTKSIETIVQRAAAPQAA